MEDEGDASAVAATRLSLAGAVAMLLEAVDAQGIIRPYLLRFAQSEMCAGCVPLKMTRGSRLNKPKLLASSFRPPLLSWLIKADPNPYSSYSR